MQSPRGAPSTMAAAAAVEETGTVETSLGDDSQGRDPIDGRIERRTDGHTYRQTDGLTVRLSSSNSKCPGDDNRGLLVSLCSY